MGTDGIVEEKKNDDETSGGKEDHDENECAGRPSVHDGISSDTCIKQSGTRISNGYSGSTRSARKRPSQSGRRAWYNAHVRTLLSVDQTQVALVPGLRTAIILMVEWSVWGIGNETSTAFQLGCLYVGFTDPNGSLGRRLHYMGTAQVCVVLVGAVLPSLVWTISWLTFVVAVLVGFVAGYAPILNSPALSQGLKLGTALFAINISVNRKTNGYGGPGVSILWTFVGASASLLAALLPEIIGDRDAIRTDLFKVWRGFGTNLQKWTSQWSTMKHYSNTPAPTVTISMSKTLAIIHNDKTEDPYAKRWLLTIMNIADTIRTASLCLSNGYEIAQHYPVTSTAEGEDTRASDCSKEIDELFLAIATTCKRVAFAFQFPWTVRYIPVLNTQLQRSVNTVKIKAANVKTKSRNANVESGVKHHTAWLSTLVDLLQTQVESIVDLVFDVETWPPYSSICSLPERICSAFPTKFKKLEKDTDRAIRSYAIRFTIAFSLATIPQLFIGDSTSAHWFPMTVVLIMSSDEGATYQKVAHRTLGTLLGIGLGSALIPLFRFPGVLILLLGLNTYAVCVFFQANYAMFTLFITAWVFCTTVGVGASVGVTVFFRCMWTLSAAALVLLVTYLHPIKTKYNVSEKLADMARVIKLYAQNVLEEHCLRAEDANQTTLEEATRNVSESRQEIIKARVNMLTCIHEAVLVPTVPIIHLSNTQDKNVVIDPHTMAPALASDLVDAVVVPQFVSLVKDTSADGLLSDFDSETFAEIDRLVARLEYISSVLSPQQGTNTTTSNDKSNEEDEARVRGPFSYAIASAHYKLDDAGVPSFVDTENSISD